jgi:hypothetical protein
VLAGCVALAALSLLGPSAPTYDPWAWLNWGRQISEVGWTRRGPSWKPLPVAFTAAFSLVDQAAAPALWLLVARAAACSDRDGVPPRRPARGPGRGRGRRRVADPGQRLRLELRPGQLGGAARRPRAVGDRVHLDGRRRRAFVLGAAAGLLRPEVWPFLAAYGVWLVHAERRRGRLGAARAGLCAGAAVVFGLLWFVPEYIGSGSFLRAAERARDAVPGSPARPTTPSSPSSTTRRRRSSSRSTPAPCSRSCSPPARGGGGAAEGWSSPWRR